MIVDFHWHWTRHKMGESEALERAENHRRTWVRMASVKPEKSLSELAKERIDASGDGDGTKLLQKMEKAGIDQTVIISDDFSYERLDNEAIMAEQKACADLAKKHPERFIAFASIIPYREKAPQLFRECIEEYGMSGLKWHPPWAHFDVNSAEAHQVLEVAQELKVPLLMHTGCIFGQTDIKYSHPLLLDQLASDFPELKIVAAHMGHILWHDWCAVSFFRRNVYGDLAAWSPFAVGQYEWFCRSLREIIDLVGVEQVLFASDGPFIECVVDNEQWVRIIKDLPRKAPEGIRFTEEEVAAILGGNAQKILGL